MFLKQIFLAVSLMGFSVSTTQASVATTLPLASGAEMCAVLPEQDLAAKCELRLIQVANIEFHQQKIAKMMQLHRYIGLAVKLGGAAALTYVTYRSLKSAFGPSATPFVDIHKDAAAVVKGAMQISQQDGERLLKAIDKANPGFFSLQWWKNNILWGINSIACSSAFGLVSAYARKYMHEEGIEWYAAEHTRIKSLADELLAYHGQTLAKLPAVQPTAQDLYLHRVTLAGIARSLVEQAEMVAGFMEYRLTYFRNQGVVLLPDQILQPTRLVATVNACVMAIQQNMVTKTETDTLDHVRALCGCVLQGVTELQQLINRFNGVENDIHWRMINGKQ